MRRRGAMATLALAALAALALRVLIFPVPVGTPVAPWIVENRALLALGGAVLGVGSVTAAVAAQALARDHRVDATLAGPAWGALPALLLPAPVWVQAAGAVAGAWLVTRVTGHQGGGLPMVLSRGVAVAGLVVSTAALVLFLGPGLTATTALAFLHAALGGQLAQLTIPRLLVATALAAASLALGLARWRQLLLARTALAPPGAALEASLALGAGAAVLVAGVVPGLGLLAVAAARPMLGEHPRALLTGGAAAGVAAAVLLDGVAQAVAWPGELPVGVVTAVVASAYLVGQVVRP